MNHNQANWSRTFARLNALAARLEDQGQYNVAKLARASAEALARRAAYQVDVPSNKKEIVQELGRLDQELAELELSAEVRRALQRGTAGFAEGKLTAYEDTPNAYVCRTCGYLVLDAPMSKCPTCGAEQTTFIKFMPNYWFDALEPFAALVTMRQTPATVSALLEDRTEEQLNQLPEDGGWAIRNIVSHLRDAQGVLAFRLDLILTQEHPTLESLAVFEWADQAQTKRETTREILDTYLASRQETVTRLEKIPLKDWWRTGQHQEFGPLTLRQHVSYFIAHEVTHLPQIKVLLAKS